MPNKNDAFELIMTTQNALGFGMAFLDPKSGQITQANSVLATIFGYTEAELLALPSIVSLVPADNQPLFRERFKGLEGGATFEIMALHKNRTRIWTEIRLRHLRVKNDSVLAAIVTDITRRREAEEQVLLLETITLAVNEARDFQSALGVVVRKVCVATGWEYGVAWVPSADGKMIGVSRVAYGAGDQLERFRKAMEGITLAPGDDLPGRAWMLRQPQWADEVLLLRSFRRQTILREFGVQISMAIPVIADTKVVAILEFCVTEKHLHVKDFFVGLASAIAPQLGSVFQKKKAEEDLRQTNIFLDQIVENIPDMIFIKDATDLRFIRFNRAGEHLLGIGRDQMIGKNDRDFFPPEEADSFTEKDRLVLKEGRLVDIPEEIIHTQHGVRILHTKKIPILDEKGTPLYLLGISEDVTGRKKE